MFIRVASGDAREIPHFARSFALLRTSARGSNAAHTPQAPVRADAAIIGEVFCQRSIHQRGINQI
jgi:hypothetical protein